MPRAELLLYTSLVNGLLFIDTRPEFVGHNMSGSSNYWFQDGIHPTQSGADAIAAKVWAQMQKYCIAQ